MNRWLRADKKRASALLDGRFDDLVDLAVDRDRRSLGERSALRYTRGSPNTSRHRSFEPVVRW